MAVACRSRIPRFSGIPSEKGKVVLVLAVEAAVETHRMAAAQDAADRSHCLPTPQLSHRVSMLLYRLLFALPYNDSKMVRTPAPRDHPPAFVRYRLPRAPETCTPFTRGFMTSEPHST
eukprot:scaffold33983_cov93-Phaeocystis_antarctica.AAC.1